PPPFGTPSAAGPPPRHPLQNCEGCDRGFRAPYPENRCRDCRAASHP
ncbi:helix-turn-helix domain-containing protein, partial [Streptomyces violaceoruber]